MRCTSVLAVVLLMQLFGESHPRPASILAPEALYFEKDSSGPMKQSKPEGNGAGSSGTHPPKSPGAESAVQPAVAPVPARVEDMIHFPVAVTDKPASEVELVTRYLISVPDAKCPADLQQGHGRDCREPE